MSDDPRYRACEYNPCGAEDSARCLLLPVEDEHTNNSRELVQSALDKGCRVARFQIERK
jgi:hypothetical protein